MTNVFQLKYFFHIAMNSECYDHVPAVSSASKIHLHYWNLGGGLDFVFKLAELSNRYLIGKRNINEGYFSEIIFLPLSARLPVTQFMSFN